MELPRYSWRVGGDGIKFAGTLTVTDDGQVVELDFGHDTLSKTPDLLVAADEVIE